jgi:uncharacterized membrane protein
MAAFGKTIVVIGAVLVIIGLILWFGGDRLGWLGRLPGDIRVERPGFRLYAPITTMILLSIVLSVVLTLIARFFR